jgi:hypothetical protein
VRLLTVATMCGILYGLFDFWLYGVLVKKRLPLKPAPVERVSEV